MFLIKMILGSFYGSLLHCGLDAIFTAIQSPPPAPSTFLAYDQQIDFLKIAESKPWAHLVGLSQEI